MCEYSDIKPKLQIAEKDIVVYKQSHYIKRNWLIPFCKRYISVSPIKEFKYKQNKVYKTILDEPALHTLVNNLGEITDIQYCSKRGFYSYEENYCHTDAKFVIPKGSKYYLYNKVYVSDKIKFIGPI